MSVETRRLGRGRVSFVGFAPVSIDASLATIDLRLERRAGLLRLRDVVVFPKQDALYDLSGRRIDQSLDAWIEGAGAMAGDAKAGMEDVEAPPFMPIPADLERRGGTAAYLGRRHHHYGHLVTDGLARAWALSPLDRRIPLVMGLLRAADLDREPMRAMFTALGAPAERFILCKRPTLFAHMILPLAALQHGRAVYANYGEPHRRISRALTAGYRNSALDRPIYLSRAGLGEVTRTVDGEAELEARLEREGYLPVRPETLSLRDQIYIFQRRRPVIGILGSALHTALFRTGWGRKPVAVLTGSTVKGRYLLPDAIKPLATTYVHALTETKATDQPAGPGEARRFTLDVDRAMDLLSMSGFFGRR